MNMRIWLWPAALAVLSGTGLVVGLIFDGAGDVFAWLALGLPIALSLWHGCIKQ
jgi:hypothetical protein